jgi:addiction module HigA family antidote
MTAVLGPAIIGPEGEAMSIKRDDLDAGRVDFSGVATAKRLPLIHPGEILRDDFLQPMKISVYALAQAIKVPRSRVNDIALGRRGITADTAFRLARYFGTTSDFWINLQARHDRRSEASPSDRARGWAAGDLTKERA